MSKVSMSSRPEPGYENMDHFSINVDYVAEMLRTIEFQTGASISTDASVPRGDVGLPGASSPPCHLVPCMGMRPIVHRNGDVWPLGTAQGPCRVRPACAPSWLPFGVPKPQGRSAPADRLPCPTEPLGEDEADGPGDSSEAAVDEDRLDSLEVPDATEGESLLCRAVLGCGGIGGQWGPGGCCARGGGGCAVLCPAPCPCGCAVACMELRGSCSVLGHPCLHLVACFPSADVGPRQKLASSPHGETLTGTEVGWEMGTGPGHGCRGAEEAPPGDRWGCGWGGFTPQGPPGCPCPPACRGGGPGVPTVQC